jgi:DNA polymerase-3 subunit alpha
VLIAGIVTALRIQASRRGKMAFVTLDDGQGSAEVAIFNETFDEVRTLLREDELLVMEVRIMQRGGGEDGGPASGLRIIADKVQDIGAIRKKFAKSLRLAFNGGADATRLHEMLAPFRPGRCAVVLQYRTPRGLTGEIEFPDSWTVNPDNALIAQLQDWLAPENVRVVY